MTAQFMEINGCRLKVVDVGPKDAPITVLTHHGAPGLGSHHEPLKTFTPLTDKYRVVAYDARGSGESADVPPYTHEQWAADMEAVRQTLDLGQVIVAGGSYGGYMSIEYTLRYPENVRGLVLRATGARNVPRDGAIEKAKASGLPIDMERLERLLSGRALSNEDMKASWYDIEALYTVQKGHTPVASGDGQTREREINFHYETHNHAFSKNLPGWDLRPRLGEIKVPTLIVHGRHDWIVDIQRGFELKEGIPHAHFHIFEDCGHSPQLEDNVRFIGLVRELIEEVLAG